jgi:hypothetical protein
VNQEYIRSAAQADAFRTEPPFKLQGSYRNMNKLAEKIVSAMTPAEVEALVDDHYQSESQTLTTAAEQNLLKLAELRGRLTPAQAKRWAEIKAEFVRQRRMGGSDTDPVVRLMGTLNGLGEELSAIGSKIGGIDGSRGTAELAREMTRELRELREAMLLAAKKASADAATRDPEAWLAPRLDALAAGLRAQAETVNVVDTGGNGHGHRDAEAILAQVRRIETTLGPVVGAALQQREGDQVLANKMVQIIELLEQLDARLALRGR